MKPTKKATQALVYFERCPIRPLQLSAMPQQVTQQALPRRLLKAIYAIDGFHLTSLLHTGHHSGAKLYLTEHKSDHTL